MHASRQSSEGWVKSLIRSLSLSLFIWVFGVIIVAFATYAVISIRSTSEKWHATVCACAERFSELIKHSTHYSMLLNRKEDVHYIIQEIAAQPGVDGVRVYDKNGTIMFSAEPEEIGRQVDLQAEACVSCHIGSEPLQTVPEGDRFRVFASPDGGRTMGLISPIENSPECSNASCHAHAPSQSVLGVLDVRMSMTTHDAQLAATRREIIIAAILTALAAGLLSAGFIFWVVRRPVKQLTNGVERVAQGELETVIQVRSRNEIGQLAGAFNAMTGDLHEARRQLTEWSMRLETNLQEKTEELSQTQRQVAHMEKMASLGKLAATVAHELNNPLAGILNYAKLVDRTFRDSGVDLPDREELDRYVTLIQKEANRSGQIVKNLLLFARRSGAEFALHRLNPILDRAVMLVQHAMEITAIQLELRHLEGDDQIICDADQVQQALVALLVNAVEAMPGGGTLGLAAESSGVRIVFTVDDSGVGIPKESLPHIFEPFYTSKNDTEGSGLGLAVVYGIIQRHGGTIEVQSEVEQGTRFRMVLPRRPSADHSAE
jgi:two-component system NtrC family sensor kinase